MAKVFAALRKLFSVAETDTRLERLVGRERRRHLPDAKLSWPKTDQRTVLPVAEGTPLYGPEVYGRFSELAAQLEDAASKELRIAMAAGLGRKGAQLSIPHSRVILVVDDEPFARLFAVQILLDYGFTILEAEDATEAIDVIEENADVSIVLTDISMPGPINGLDLAREVKRRRPEAKVVVTSGAVPFDTATFGDTAFLPKPYTATALLNAILEQATDPVAATPSSLSVNMLGHR